MTIYSAEQGFVFAFAFYYMLFHVNGMSTQRDNLQTVKEAAVKSTSDMNQWYDQKKIYQNFIYIRIIIYSN